MTAIPGPDALDAVLRAPPALPYTPLTQSVYLAPRPRPRERFGPCECPRFDPVHPELACGPDCLNRMLLVECVAGCPVGKPCTNRNFQRNNYASVEVFDAGPKGSGLRAVAPIAECVFPCPFFPLTRVLLDVSFYLV